MIELLGNNVIEETSGGSKEVKKYNLTINSFLGDVDANGVLQAPSVLEDAIFTGVKEIPAGTQNPSATSLLNYKFLLSSIKNVSFPDLVNIGNYGLSNAFRYSKLETISFEKLENINQGAFTNAFANCSNLRSILFPAVKTLNGVGCSGICQNSTNITSLSFPELTEIQGMNAFTGAFAGVNNVEIFFPKLTTIWDGGSGQQPALNWISMNSNNMKLHFKAGMESTIQALTGYPNFDGEPITYVYDL